jgi:uncharacterized membrane protein (DUF106 family)
MGSYTVVTLTIAVDTLYFMNGRIIVENFKMVQQRFRNAIQKGNSEDIKKIVDIQNEIIMCCSLLQNLYSPIIFQRYIFMTINICVLGFEISTVIFE